MTKSDTKNSGIKLPSEKEKTDAIAEKARELTAGFNAEVEAENTLTKASMDMPSNELFSPSKLAIIASSLATTSASLARPHSRPNHI